MEAIQNITREIAGREINPVTSSSKIKNNLSGAETEHKNSARGAEQSKESLNESISRIAEIMDSYVQSMQRDLKIQVDDRTGRIVIKVTSKESGKTIREIPPEELLDLAARIEEITGILFDEKV